MTLGNPDTAAPSGATSVSSDTIAEPITSNEIALLKRLIEVARQAAEAFEVAPVDNDTSELLALERANSNLASFLILNPSLLASAEENARLRAENERLEDLARDVCTAGCDDDIARALHALRDFLTPRIAERARARAALGAPKTTDNGGCP